MVARQPLRIVPASRPTGARAAATSFVGRRAERHALRARIGPERVITLVGPPGVGKSRLALELAPDGALEVSARGARAELDLVGAIAAALEVRLPEGDARAEALGRIAARRAPPLVIVDACEGLDDEAAAALASFAAAAGAPVLLTSQRPLRVAREQVFELSPLDASDARALLTERVRHARRGGGLSAAEIDRLDDLVARLSGLPLALELAGSRLAVLDVAELLARLDDGVGVLDDRSVLSRTVDWAIGLLEPHDREGLAQATCFRGGFDLAAAEAVIELGPRSVLDWLAAMVSRSLVAVRRGPDGTRYSLYEAVEHRAARSHAEARARAEGRHAAYFAHAAADRAAEGGTAHRRWIHRERANLAAAEARAQDPVVFVELVLAHEVGRLGGVGFERDRERLNAAVGRAREVEGAPALAARALLELGRFLRLRGRFEEAVGPLDEAVSLGEAAGLDGLRATTLVERARLRVCVGEYAEAEPALRAGLALDPDRPRLAGDVHVSLGVIRLQADDDLAASEREFERAGGFYEAAGDRVGRAIALANASAVARNQERFEAARRGYAQAAALHAAEGNLRGEGIARSNLANVERCMGRYEESRATFEEALRLHRFVGNRRSEALACCFYGFLEMDVGDLDAARARLERARAIGESVTNAQDFALIVDGLVRLAELCGDEDRARAHRAEAEALRAETPALRVAADGSWFERDGERVCLRKRRSARLVLAALVALRERSSGEPMSRERLIEAGWPGERILEKAARQRAYVLINTLRKLGLHALETTDDGYRLDPAVPLHVQ